MRCILFVTLSMLSSCNADQEGSSGRSAGSYNRKGAQAVQFNDTKQKNMIGTNTDDSTDSLYTRNLRPDERGTLGDTVILTQSGIVGSTDCNIHTNRQPEDPCSFDFCGGDAQNSHLSPEVYATVKALVAALKAQNKFPSPCSNLTVIKTLASLQTLDLSGKNLSDLTPLARMVNLVELNIDNNQVSDLSPLRYMSSLKILKANSNKIVYLNPLSNDLALEQLYLSNNQITRVEALVPLTKLTSLNISNNKVESILPLALDRKMGINITGNPGIITEIKTVDKAVIKDDGCSSFWNVAFSVSCTWGKATLMINKITASEPIPTQN